MKKERLIQEFVELVAIDSPTFQEGEIAKVLREKLEEIGFVVKEDTAGEAHGGNAGNLYGYLEGALEGEPILFSSHMDTVVPALGKKAIIHEDGRITSAGDTILGADDITGLVAILEAIRSLREEGIPHRSIEIIFPIAEEIYAVGSSAFDYSIVKSKECYVLDLSGPVGRAAYTAPSILSFKAVITGRASHAGFNPEEGIHAIAIASRAISRMRLGRIDEITTANVGTITGGMATNIVPERCVVEGEVRSFDHSQALSVIEEMRIRFLQEANLVGGTLEWSQQVNTIAYETDVNSIVAKRYEDACNKLGISCEFVKTLGGSDLNVFALHGIHGLVLSNAMNLVHSTEEYTEIDELVRSTEIVKLLMTSNL